MNKIASPQELQHELRRLLAYSQSERPSRARIATELRTLSEALGNARVAGSFDTERFDRRTATTVPTDYAQAKALKDELEAESKRTSLALKDLSGDHAGGLTPASVQATPEWKAAKRESDAAFAALRNFNAIYVKRFKKEMMEDRRRRGR